jgi:hypothetical protein
MRDAVSVRDVEKETQINQIETHPTIPSSSSTLIAEIEGARPVNPHVRPFCASEQRKVTVFP